MSKFKIGDRIACYGQNKDGNFDAVSAEGDHGQIIEVMESGFIVVKLDQKYSDNQLFIFHPKQCRILKPKRKAREFWLLPINGKDYDVADFDPRIAHPDANWNGVIQVREFFDKKLGK